MLDFDSVVEEMKSTGDALVPYNFPLNNPELENDLFILKSRFIEIDGYDVGLHFNRSDYNVHYLETLQIFGEKIPFLPFHLVAKIGRQFLGSHHLYLVEFIRSNRKVYCWTICLDREGRPIPQQTKLKSEDCDYEGFQYRYLYPSEINYY